MTTAFDLDPNIKWLFCFTHPDDELSIVAWINRLVKSGAQVYLAWSHSNPIREKESRKVASEIGLNQENLTFLTGTDGAICDELLNLKPQFESLISRVSPDRIACGAFEQGHLDHDATNFLVTEIFGGPIFEIPFYNSYVTRLMRMNRFSKEENQEIIDLTPEEQDLKVRLAKMYPSQNIYRCLLVHEALQFCLGRGINIHKTERMRLQGKIDYLRPIHADPVLKRLQNHKSWQRWESAVNAYRNEFTMASN